LAYSRFVSLFLFNERLFIFLRVFFLLIDENGRTHAYSLPALAFVLSLWQRVGVSALFHEVVLFSFILLIINELFIIFLCIIITFVKIITFFLFPYPLSIFCRFDLFCCFVVPKISFVKYLSKCTPQYFAFFDFFSCRFISPEIFFCQVSVEMHPLSILLFFAFFPVGLYLPKFLLSSICSNAPPQYFCSF
jgi:hypothetical protein